MLVLTVLGVSLSWEEGSDPAGSFGQTLGHKL